MDAINSDDIKEVLDPSAKDTKKQKLPKSKKFSDFAIGLDDEGKPLVVPKGYLDQPRSDLRE